MVDRGDYITRLGESLRLSREALARNVGNPTEQDWRAQVARYEARLRAALGVA